MMQTTLAINFGGQEMLIILLIIVLGFYPKPVTDVINPAVQATMQDVGRTDPAPEVGSVQEAAK